MNNPYVCILPSVYLINELTFSLIITRNNRVIFDKSIVNVYIYIYIYFFFFYNLVNISFVTYYTSFAVENISMQSSVSAMSRESEQANLSVSFSYTAGSTRKRVVAASPDGACAWSTCTGGNLAPVTVRAHRY
jgi:hypothetical protein